MVKRDVWLGEGMRLSPQLYSAWEGKKKLGKIYEEKICQWYSKKIGKEDVHFEN